MANIAQLKKGQNYTAVCSAENPTTYSFVFNGNEEQTITFLKEKFSSKGKNRDVALDCGENFQDTESSGSENFSKLSLWDAKNSVWGESEMKCWDDSVGENLIIITGSL